MTDKKINRSYLYGYLLAILEEIEILFDMEDCKKVTYARKKWCFYQKQPAVTLQLLLNTTSVALLNLMESDYDTFIKLELEKQEIIQLLAKHYLSSGELNKPLDYLFIWGYYSRTFQTL